MFDAAAIVLAGGRSSRMGAPKAALDWHGSTLVRRVTGIVARGVEGPVIVVRAPGQELPALPAAVKIVQDAREGQGPVQGLAAGLAAVAGRAAVAYVSATDAPLLHPAFVRRVVDACGDEVDVALPRIGGYRQPLAAAYRVELLDTVEELIAAGRLRPGFLFERCRVVELDEAAMLADPAVARADPQLASVRNLNEPVDYERAQVLPGPAIQVTRSGPLTREATPSVQMVPAWSLGELAATLGLALGAASAATLNGEDVAIDPELPLVAGDAVAFAAAAGGRASREAH
ncbi:MAG TPA: molybdenum cofactor guanylyltransferase [Solirubrobacteraceae bacterium]|nr:molybdenum cofactor guanylyltransferase [Solirubrobacteraceae bacterium]